MSVEIVSNNIVIDVVEDEKSIIVEDEKSIIVEIVDVGLRGEKGDKGVSAEYVHYQSTPSNVWTINHNLNKICGITCFTDGGIKIEGADSIINSNQTLVHFNNEISGFAYVI